MRLLQHVLSPRMGLWSGRTGPVARSCGENAQTHGSRGGWGGPSATSETRLTDCNAGSCSDGRDERDPLCARTAGRERPPENGPGLRKRAFQGGRSSDHSLQEGCAAAGLPRCSTRASAGSRTAIQIQCLVSIETPVAARSIVTVTNAGNVAVVAHHNSTVVSIEPTVIQQMRGEIDVRSLLLGPDHLCSVPPRQRLRKWRSRPVSERTPKRTSVSGRKRWRARRWKLRLSS